MVPLLKILFVEDQGLFSQLVYGSCRRTLCQPLPPDQSGDGQRLITKTQLECRWASSARSARRIVSEWPPDLAFIDVSLPDESGVSLARDWFDTFPSTRLVGMSALPDELTVVRIAGAKFHGIIAKSLRSRTEIPQAITEVLGGKTYISPMFREVRQRVFRDPKHFGHRLSEREMAVLELLAHGLDDDEVAQLLDVEPSTAHKHRQNVMRKLDVHSSAKLVAKAVSLGFGRSGVTNYLATPDVEDTLSE